VTWWIPSELVLLVITFDVSRFYFTVKWFEHWAGPIYYYEYHVHRMKVEVTILNRLPTADIVVFHNDICKHPYAVVECEKDGITDAGSLARRLSGISDNTLCLYTIQ